MIANNQPNSRVSHCFLPPHFIKTHIETFLQLLTGQGYSLSTLKSYEESIAHFGVWLNSNNFSIQKIDVHTVSRFSEHLCNCPGGRNNTHVSQRYVKRIGYFVEFLSQSNIINCKFNDTQKSLPSEVVDFTEQLRLRGLSPFTIANYERYALKTLPLLGDDPQKYNAEIVKKSIFGLAEKCSLAETKKLTTALRVYLRFLAVEKLCVPDLDCAVPTVAQWSLSSMPRYISAQDVERVIDSCDIETNKGVRDRAIILLLARLGLRGGDIINMRLSDIDWNAGTLCVQGKSHREDKLPLPQEVGDAIFIYLEQVRQPAQISRIFLCLNAPFRAFSYSNSISNIVDAALIRAEILNPPSRGAHLLRHSAATNLLRSGATLEIISAVLRHRSLDMTAYYAKVDFPMLQKITQPWPEEAPC